MNRREFVEKLGAGSAVAVAGGALAGSITYGSAEAQESGHQHTPISGPLANATVSFGAWPQPLDRLAALPPGVPPPNVHQLIPNVTTIKAGGTVNFIVAGFHNIAVYGNGTTPDDINDAIRRDVPGAPPGFPQLIDDSNNRVFRGIASFPPVNIDRVEVVNFPEKGQYLVICAFVPHFEDNMWGWVKVV
jgi:plastocyanin